MTGSKYFKPVNLPKGNRAYTRIPDKCSICTNRVNVFTFTTQENKGTNMEEFSEDDEIQNCQGQYFREKSKSCDKVRKMKENQSKIKRQGNKDTDVKCNVKEVQNKEPLKQITSVNVIETVVNDEIQDSKDTFTYRDQIKSVNKIYLSKPKKLQTDLNTKSSSNGEILQYREEIKVFNKDCDAENSLSQDPKDKSKYYDKSELLMKTRSRTKKLQGDDGTESLSNLGNAPKSLKEGNIEIITEKVELADAQDQDSTDKLRCHGKIKSVKLKKSRAKKQQNDTELSSYAEVEQKEPLVEKITNMSSENVEVTDGLDQDSKDKFQCLDKIKPVKLKKSRTKKRENVHDTEFSSDAEVTQNKEPLIEKNTKMSTKNVEVTDGQDQDSKDEFRCYDKIIAVKKKSKTKKQQNDHDSELSSYEEVTQNKESLKTENIEIITENVEIMDDQVEDFKDMLQRPQKIKPIKKTRSRTKKRQGDCDTKLSSNVEGVENKESSIDENTQMLTEKFQCYVNIKTMKTNLTSKELQSDLNTESTNNFGKPLKELYRNIDEMNSRDKHKNCDIMKAIKKKRTRKVPNCEDTESSIDLIEGTPKIDTTKTQSHTMKSSDDEIATLIMQVTTPTLESHIRNGNQLNQNAKISKENSQLLGICNDFNGNEISMKENVHLLSENDILERSYITHIMQKQSNKTQNIEVKKQLYDVATELVLSQSRRTKKEEQNQSYKSTTVQERLSQSDTTLFIKPKQKKVRTLFNENDQSYLDAINYDIDSVEAKIFEISQREAEQDYKVPLKRIPHIRKQTKVMKRKMSDSDSDIPRPIITSALVHASQAGELSTIKNVATQQCVQIKKINDDLDIVQVDNSTQLNEIAIRKPLNLPTSLTTLNKPGKEEASTNWEFEKVRNLPDEATNEVKEIRKSKDEDFKKRSNEDYVHRKSKKTINLRNQQGPSISKNKSKRYSRKQKFEEPEKKRRKMNTTHVKRTNSTKHNSNKANKKDRERQLEFSRFMTDFLEDVELTRTGDYSKSDMLLRGAREYDCESIDSDVPLAKIRKRKRLTPTKGELCHQLFDSNSLSNKSIGALGINTRAENIKKNNRKIMEQLHDPDDINDMGLKFAARDEQFLQISKRSKLKEISSKSVDSQKTELSSLPELYIEKTKKQDYILLYTSSPSDEIGLPRCEQPGNSIEEIINKSPQGHNTKSEMIERRSDKSSKNTNSHKLLSSYIKLEKLKQPTIINNNNSVSNSIFEQETVTKLIQAKSECLQNGDRSNTLTDSKKVKIKILQNILLRPQQHVSEVNSHGSENRRSNNDGGVVTQLTPQTIASWICTGNTESQISQRLLEVLLQFFNNATKIVLEDMKGPIPPHLLELFETFSELDASLDKLFSK